MKILKVSKGANHPTCIINLESVSGAWIEPCYKTDKDTFDRAGEIAAYIEKEIEPEPKKIQDDVRLMTIIEEGINSSADYIPDDAKIRIRSLLLDRYHGKISDDHKLMVNVKGSKWEVGIYPSRELAMEKLNLLAAKMDNEAFCLD